MEMKTTLAQDCNSIALVRYMVIIVSCSSKIYLFLQICFWSSEVKCLCKCNMYYSTAKTRRFSPVAVWLIKHRPGSGRASADLLKSLLKVPGDCQTSYDARTVGARPMRANTGRAPSFYHQWTFQAPYGRRVILSSTLTSPGTVLCLKLIKNRTILSPADFGELDAVRCP